MKVSLVTFASKCFYPNQKELVESAKKNGIEKIFSWKYLQLILYKFFWKNFRLLRNKRGAGYWIWHSFIIRKALNAVEENQLVFFCDAGLKMIGSLDHLIPLMKDNFVLLFSSGHFLNRQYTKRDAFILMDADEEKYWNAKQISGGIHIWKKCPEAYRLLEEYEAYCCKESIVSDSANTLGENFSDFVDHRHPQSILSILAVKYGLHVEPIPIRFPGNNGDSTKTDQCFLIPNRNRHYSFLDKILYKIGLWY